MNLLVEKIKNDKDHYDTIICDSSKFIASLEVKKEINDEQNKKKRIKLEIELCKIINKDEYFFRINNINKVNHIKSDEFYSNVYKIK